MPSTSLLIIILTITSLAIASVALGLAYLRLQAKSKSIDKSQEKGYQVLYQAIKKAQALLASSELDALKITADTRFYKHSLEEKFDKEIEKYFEEANKKLTEAQKQYLDYLNYLKVESDSSRNESTDVIRTRIQEIFDQFEANLTDYLSSAQQQSTQAIELELKATRGMIENYKLAQLKVIDDNIIAMLEKTLTLVLAKKLTLSDQLDLVYEALEKAKEEKFIV